VHPHHAISSPFCIALQRIIRGTDFEARADFPALLRGFLNSFDGDRRMQRKVAEAPLQYAGPYTRAGGALRARLCSIRFGTPSRRLGRRELVRL
jgi:hypothetical protein